MRQRKLTHLAALCGALFAATTAFDSSVSAQKATFGEVQEVVAVEIPVQVLVDGKPVAGLTKESFEVLEGRKPRQIVDFEVVNLTTATSTTTGRAVAAEPEVAPAGRRHFLLLFDLTNSDPTPLIKARGAARELVNGSLHPTDLVGVATWSYTKGPRLVLGFTTDRRQIDAAVDTLGVVDLRNRTPDPLNLILEDVQSAASRPDSTSTAGGAGGGRAAGEEAYEENIRQFAAGERAAVRQVKTSELESLTQGFATLASLMSNVTGRKYVVLLSQGFDSTIVSGSTDMAMEQQNFDSSASGEIYNINSEERFGSTSSMNQLEEMLAVFRRADCAIQAVDIGGLGTSGAGAGDSGRKSDRSSLLTMAKDTGGQLYENFNNLGQAMGKMLESTSITYVLTIQPEDIKLDGKFHDLKVKLVGGPPGARLVHRPGYYAPKPYEQKAGMEQQIDTAQLIVSGEPGGDLVAGVAAAAFRGEGDRMHVPVVVEAEGALLASAAKTEKLPLSVYVYAFDAAGTVRDFVTQSLQLDMKQVGAQLQREPFKFVADLRLPPGDYSLRTLVRAGATGAYWLGRTPLTVPAFTPGTIEAVAPLVPQPMVGQPKAGIVIRSSTSAERTQGLAFPFMMGTEVYLPSGLPSVARGGNLKACLNVYGLDASGITVKGELVDEEGRTVPDAEVKVVGRTASDQPGLQRIELAVKPGSAPAGPYSLRVTVEQTGKSASSSAAVRVSS